MKRTLNSIVVIILAATVLTGCQQRLVFTTQSSIGLDVSGTAQYPNKVSFSYNRYEGTIVPRKPGDSGNNGHSVYGGMDTDVKFRIPPRYQISQVFATGKAAENAVVTEERTQTERQTQSHPDDDTNSTRSLIFFTGTTFGVHLTLGEQEMSPNALLGYRRSETAIVPIPVRTEDVRSVYADIQISNTNANGQTAGTLNIPEPSRLGGVRIRQSFATGRAAEKLAQDNQRIRDKLAEAAGAAAAVKDYSVNFDKQERLVLETIEEFCNGDEAKRKAIFDKAIELELVPSDSTLDGFTKALRGKIDGNDYSRTDLFQELKEFAEEQI